LALPIPAGNSKIPGIKIHDTRMLRLMEVLLHRGTQLGGWRSRGVQGKLCFGIVEAKLFCFAFTQEKQPQRGRESPAGP